MNPPARFATPVPSAPARSQAARGEGSRSEAPIRWGFLEWFLVIQTFLGAAALMPGFSSIRLGARILPFIIGFLPFVVRFRQYRSKTQLACQGLLIIVGAIYCVMIFHPLTNAPLAGVASAALNISVMAPAFWAPMLVQGPKHVRRLLLIYLIYCGIDSGLGILQTRYPDRFIPADMRNKTEEYRDSGYLYEGRDGDIIRPPGLSSTPGAACVSGMVGGLLAISFLLDRSSLMVRIFSLGTLFLGTSVIYLSMVRTSILILGGMCVVLCGLQVMQGRFGKGVLVLSAAFAGIVGGLIYAVDVGGDVVENRYSTLVTSKPGELYYNSRGAIVEATFSQSIFEYPVGAGLARWGVVRGYFGDETNTYSPAFFIEVQFLGWVFDGGPILLLIYSLAILMTLKFEWRLALHASDPELRVYAATICALGCGFAVLCFSFVPFTCQVGSMFWFLAGCLAGASKAAPRVAANSAAPRPAR